METIDFKRLSCKEKGLVKKGYNFTGFWTRRCSKKGCGFGFRVEATLDGWDKVVAVPCPKCGWVSKKPEYTRAERIFGRLNEAHQCNSKCMNAKGPACDCACGGLNHGCGYSGGSETGEAQATGGIASPTATVTSGKVHAVRQELSPVLGLAN